mmetsp:Transcript_4035/g.11457  ORF Transcript_4035/g.11457 Transcript_4035/m.11457 type:complete len:238 (+) Transcript_4035:153-866(+)
MEKLSPCPGAAWGPSCSSPSPLPTGARVPPWPWLRHPALRPPRRASSSPSRCAPGRVSHCHCRPWMRRSCAPRRASLPQRPLRSAPTCPWSRSRTSRRSLATEPCRASLATSRGSRARGSGGRTPLRPAPPSPCGQRRCFRQSGAPCPQAHPSGRACSRPLAPTKRRCPTDSAPGPGGAQPCRQPLPGRRGRRACQRRGQWARHPASCPPCPRGQCRRAAAAPPRSGRPARAQQGRA